MKTLHGFCSISVFSEAHVHRYVKGSDWSMWLEKGSQNIVADEQLWRSSNWNRMINFTEHTPEWIYWTQVWGTSAVRWQQSEMRPSNDLLGCLCLPMWALLGHRSGTQGTSAFLRLTPLALATELAWQGPEAVLNGPNHRDTHTFQVAVFYELPLYVSSLGVDWKRQLCL